MLDLFRDLLRHSERPRTLLVVDETGVAPPRQYTVRPRLLFGSALGVMLVGGFLFSLLVLLTPARQLILGPDPETLRASAQENAMRTAALMDSLTMQQEYLAVLRSALIGEADSLTQAALEDPYQRAEAWTDSVAAPTLPARSSDWADHEAPALGLGRMEARPRVVTVAAAAEHYLTSLHFPTLPPVEGFLARGYDAARGHFAIDIAVEEDTPVRAIGDGYVVFADWTNDGGYTLAIQHTDGYLSVYKHNRQLLKRVGDRVRSREAVARSGNTGEISTGPHLHFELWRNGLAQDPRQHLVGL